MARAPAVLLAGLGSLTLEPLTAFGVASVVAMLVCYALESRASGFVLAFALACWSSAAYAWLLGAWPFTAVEVVWGVVAVRRYADRRESEGGAP